MLLPTMLLALMPAGGQARAAGMEVDVELVLAVDVSRSMSAEELEIQRHGYAAAITDPRVIEAIRAGMLGRIAVTYLEWAANFNQRVSVDWQVIEGEADAQAFAGKLMALTQQGMQRTSISGAIEKASELLEGNGFDGLKRVIDVSGDGPNNQGTPVALARDKAVAEGIVINGLPLMTSSSQYSAFAIDDLDLYYANCVIGGPASFSLPVTSWEEFPEAVRRKLIIELAGPARVPESASVVRTQGLAAPDPDYDCLIGEKIWQQRGLIYNEP